MKKVKEFFAKLFHSDSWLKLFALFLAVIFWLYIVSVGDTTRTTTYQSVPVTFAYEGTAPYNNGLMPLINSRSYNVAVEASGQRVDLMNFSKDDIQVSFDFSRITEAGTYKVPLIISSNDPAVTVSVIGDDSVSMTFTEKASIDIEISVKQTGEYPQGYIELERLVSPQSVTIEGPKDVVEKIKYAEIQLSLTNRKRPYSELADIFLLAEDRSYVDRTYLTVSSMTANVEVDLVYRRDVKLQANLRNTLGGNESSYTTVTYSSPYLQLQGDEALFTTSTLIIGDISLEEIKTQTATRTYTIVPPEGLTCVDDIMEITVNIDMGESQIKNTEITAEALAHCHIINAPEDKNVSINSDSVYVTLRALPYVHDNPDVENWSYYIDLNEDPNTEGKYPLHITIPHDVPAGLLSRPYVEVIIEDAE